MKHQPSPIHSVLLAALLLGGSLVASAAENTGGQPNPPATPTWTVGATPAPSNLTIKNKSTPRDRVAAPESNGIEDRKVAPVPARPKKPVPVPDPADCRYVKPYPTC